VPTRDSTLKFTEVSQGLGIPLPALRGLLRLVDSKRY
jgi:hypothetical protein